MTSSEVRHRRYGRRLEIRRARRKKGFFVGFDFSEDSIKEISGFFKREHAVIVPLTVREILDEHIAQKLA